MIAEGIIFTTRLPTPAERAGAYAYKRQCAREAARYADAGELAELSEALVREDVVLTVTPPTRQAEQQVAA